MATVKSVTGIATEAIDLTESNSSVALILFFTVREKSRLFSLA